MPFRSPAPDEARILRELAHLAGIEDPGAWVDSLQVEEMDDGGMGSLRINSTRPELGRRGVISCRAAVQFTDADGVEVVASLNADQDGVPIELDMWKTDFSPLIHVPQQFHPVKD